MIQIGKTLYVMNDKTYIHCEHDTFIIENGENKERIPVSIIQQIIIFGHTSISDYMIKECADNNILVSYVSPSGRYFGSFYGKNVGNVVLRQKQYSLYEDTNRRLNLTKNIVLGKALNQRNLLLKYSNVLSAQEAARHIGKVLGTLSEAKDIESVRGIEGSISSIYFGAFDDMINSSDANLKFVKRSKHPPENNFNALLSFLYTLLNLNCISALECYGLDSYLGFLHEPRSGRESLASDLIEEFRSLIVDSLVLEWVNRKEFTSDDFELASNVPKLKDKSRKKLLQLWEQKQAEEIYYPLYQKYIPRRILMFLQAQQLAQFIRGDIPEYPPWYGGE